MKVLLIVLMLIPQLAYCQMDSLGIFDNLIDRNWKAEGKWGDGSIFKQEINYQYALNNAIIITDSKGFVDKANKFYGNRNHGIRAYDPSTKKIQFSEYDVFGGITTGTVIPMGKSMLYQYQYGDYFISEMWEYVNDSTYNFIVGDYKEKDWQQVYLRTQFKAGERTAMQRAFINLKKNLCGNWSAQAWDGVLNENWFIDENGDLVQKAKYIVDQEVQYEASNKIDLIDGELLLISVIKNGNPKIFKASAVTNKEITFTNSDYKNPSEVVYLLKGESTFHRKISGVEEGKPSNYTFEFEKIK